MTIPKFGQLLRPVLVLTQSSTISRASAAEAMVRHFQLDEAAASPRIPSGQSTYIGNRTGWPAKIGLQPTATGCGPGRRG